MIDPSDDELEGSSNRGEELSHSGLAGTLHTSFRCPHCRKFSRHSPGLEDGSGNTDFARSKTQDEGGGENTAREKVKAILKKIDLRDRRQDQEIE